MAEVLEGYPYDWMIRFADLQRTLEHVSCRTPDALEEAPSLPQLRPADEEIDVRPRSLSEMTSWRQLTTVARTCPN